MARANPHGSGNEAVQTANNGVESNSKISEMALERATLEKAMLTAQTHAAHHGAAYGAYSSYFSALKDLRTKDVEIVSASLENRFKLSRKEKEAYLDALTNLGCGMDKKKPSPHNFIVKRFVVEYLR